ncbi:MAG: NAD-dependent protein deacetylase [Sandaracinaceae bacterium]
MSGAGDAAAVTTLGLDGIAPVDDAAIDALMRVLGARRIVALTGAGLSTESGIPDYRGPETRRRARNPVKFQSFIHDDAARRRYWARSAIGWRTFREKQPNDGHRALAELEANGAVDLVITQNVDRLHGKAGSRGVVELHGALAEVRCLACGAIEARDDLQDRLLSSNPGFDVLDAAMAPDGDADLEDARLASFRVPTCLACGGTLKPNVVFFGEGVPRDRVERAYAAVDAASALLVVGTSLAVFSGLRFVRRAKERGQPIALVNLGESRGAPLADAIVEGRAADVLPRLARAIRG